MNDKNPPLAVFRVKFKQSRGTPAKKFTGSDEKLEAAKQGIFLYL